MNLLQQIRLFSAAVAFTASASAVFAAEPAGYYSSCEDKYGKDLLSALCAKIGSHTTVSYGGLLDLYKTSDVYPEDGKIWDMYSTKHWTVGTTCGNYSKIGDCYNREHSMPKSWFNDASPMYSDAFHIYPTDGKVNGQRSNYPYGECSGGTKVSSSGGVSALGRLGKSTFAGYSGTVFEPDDEYKGDFARSYFYMAACYNDRISSWKSDMLAGNSYPVFTSWSVELLLKWHRMDPVSQKEIDRNEVVYGKQNNRNPFIDHPELAEHIWGDSKTEGWKPSGSAVAAAINKPVNNSEFSLGTTAAGVSVEKKLAVLTTGVTGNVTFSVGGGTFVVTPNSITAAQANAGTEVTVTYTPTGAGSHSARLTVTAGSVKSSVMLLGKAVEGLPVGDPAEITDRSFTPSWVYIGDADAQGNYTLTVADDAGNLPGYPKAVNAQAGQYKVDGLQSATEYRYKLASQSFSSEWFTVRTGEAVPSIDFLFDGELYFVTAPGEPSEVAQILIDTDNIDADYTVSVSAPFEISLDRSAWQTSLTLSPDESRMYMRLNSAKEGTFETVIKAVCGNYVSDDAIVRGIASSSPDFLEDFEAEGSYGTYSAQTYYGNACVWNLNDAGIWAGDPVHSGDYALRAGKSAEAVIEMAEDRSTGIGNLSFYARRYNNDAEAKFNVEYSTDGGVTYTKAGDVTVSGTAYDEYTVFIGASGTARVRLVQESGKRVLIDDIALTNYSTGVDDPAAARHTWDAYSHSGTLYVDVTAPEGIDLAVYSIDGLTLYSGCLEQGRAEFSDLTPGMVCIVAAGDFSRTVIIR